MNRKLLIVFVVASFFTQTFAGDPESEHILRWNRTLREFSKLSQEMARGDMTRLKGLSRAARSKRISTQAHTHAAKLREIRVNYAKIACPTRLTELRRATLEFLTENERGLLRFSSALQRNASSDELRKLSKADGSSLQAKKLRLNQVIPHLKLPNRS